MKAQPGITSAATAPLDWDAWPTRFVFFTGKGGVGKTTIAAAAAVRLADTEHRVLIVSTDPASNLADVLDTPTSSAEPIPVRGVANLDVLDLDPQSAADAYRERALAPYRGMLPEAEMTAFTEQLSGACTVEVAAFDAFARLLADPAQTRRYDQVVFDTAPTGHTLRLLSLPAAWSSYLAESPNQASCLGPLAALDAQRQVYTDAVTALGDRERTELVLVSRADGAALAEAARAATELGALGIRRQRLIVNGVLTMPTPGDKVAQQYAESQQAALAALPDQLLSLPTAYLPLAAGDLTGIPALRALARTIPTAGTALTTGGLAPSLPGVDDLIDTLVAGPAHTILVTGKGGVGKTTVAAQIAYGLAHRGLPVHLSTTDPAGRTFDLAARPPNLTASRIDPSAELAKYVTAKLDAARDLDAHHRDLLEEELRSPCTEELAVFRAFSGLLTLSRHQFVVIDTAPSGHTLLLLDLTGAYHRQALHSLGARAAHAVTPLMRLQNPDFSRLLIVTLAETTPVAEAAELQQDLRRAGVEPFGWVINASLAATKTHDPVLSGRASLEKPLINAVSERLSPRTWMAAWQSPATAKLPDLVLPDAAQAELTTSSG